MPYIITTKRQHVWQDMPTAENESGVCSAEQIVSRRAVATLEEARKAVQGGWTWHQVCERIPESGGTVGPLPDGTVIEVQEFDWGGLILAAGFDPHDGTRSYTEPEILDAFNARQP